MPYSLLLEILNVPEEPLETGTADDWIGVEQKIGTPLPNDYKEFINNFGTGCFGGFLYVWNPFAHEPHIEWFSSYAMHHKILEAVFGDWEIYPHSMRPTPTLYPALGGILPFGTTIDGNNLCWVTKGSPNEWMVFILAPRENLYDVYDMDLTTFLYKFLKSEIHGNAINSKSLGLFTVGV